MKVRVATYKATDEAYLRAGGSEDFDFTGDPVTMSPILELGGDKARTAIQNALAELESGQADQIEITRVAEDRAFGDLLDAVFCPICGGRLHVDEGGSETGKRLLCDRHGKMRVYVTYPQEAQ